MLRRVPGGLHNLAQPPQAEHILGEQVVFGQPGVFGAVFPDDGEVVIVQQDAALRRYSLAHVKRTSLSDDGLGREQLDGCVNRPTIPGDLDVATLGCASRKVHGDLRLGLLVRVLGPANQQLVVALCRPSRGRMLFPCSARWQRVPWSA